MHLMGPKTKCFRGRYQHLSYYRKIDDICSTLSLLPHFIKIHSFILPFTFILKQDVSQEIEWRHFERETYGEGNEERWINRQHEWHKYVVDAMQGNIWLSFSYNPLLNMWGHFIFFPHTTSFTFYLLETHPQGKAYFWGFRRLGS